MKEIICVIYKFFVLNRKIKKKNCNKKKKKKKSNKN